MLDRVMVVKVNVEDQIDKLKVKKEIDSDHKIKVISTRFGARRRPAGRRTERVWRCKRRGLVREKIANEREDDKIVNSVPRFLKIRVGRKFELGSNK